MPHWLTPPARDWLESVCLCTGKWKPAVRLGDTHHSDLHPPSYPMATSFSEAQSPVSYQVKASPCYWTMSNHTFNFLICLFYLWLLHFEWSQHSLDHLLHTINRVYVQSSISTVFVRWLCPSANFDTGSDSPEVCIRDVSVLMHLNLRVLLLLRDQVW